MKPGLNSYFSFSYIVLENQVIPTFYLELRSTEGIHFYPKGY